MFAPFHDAPLIIQVHILASLLAAALMPVQFLGFRKGSLAHRLTGYGWLGAMVAVAVSSFGIVSKSSIAIAGLGVIHLLSITTLFATAYIVFSARRGAIIAHRKAVQSLSIAFAIAGLFTLMPSRIMGQIVRGLFA